METTDYSIFKYLKDNREINRSHVNRLIESIQEENLLQINPILVNKEMEIIDGQHRLEACKLLEIPVHYKVVDDVSHKALCLLQTSNTWKIGDYLKFHAATKDSYVKVIDLIQKYEITPSLATSIMTFFSKEYSVYGLYKMKRLFNEGKFDQEKVDWEKLYDFFDYHVKFKEIFEKYNVRPITIYTSDSCIYALAKFLTKHDIDRKEFLEKVEMQWYSLRPVGRAVAYYEDFINLYNYRRKNRIDK